MWTDQKSRSNSKNHRTRFKCKDHVQISINMIKIAQCSRWCPRFGTLIHTHFFPSRDSCASSTSYQQRLHIHYIQGVPNSNAERGKFVLLWSKANNFYYTIFDISSILAVSNFFFFFCTDIMFLPKNDKKKKNLHSQLLMSHESWVMAVVSQPWIFPTRRTTKKCI